MTVVVSGYTSYSYTLPQSHFTPPSPPLPLLLFQAIGYGMVLMDGNVVNINKLKKLSLSRVDRLFRVSHIRAYTYTAATSEHNSNTQHVFCALSVAASGSSPVWRCPDPVCRLGERFAPLRPFQVDLY